MQVLDMDQTLPVMPCLYLEGVPQVMGSVDWEWAPQVMCPEELEGAAQEIGHVDL